MSTSSGDTNLSRIPRRKRFIPKYEVEGVARFTFDEEAQIELEISVGPDVTAQRPWKFIDKNLLETRLELLQEACEFYSLKDEILEYPDEQFLIGYIPDESRDTDDYYLCYTPQARDHCKEQSDKFIRRQQKKLEKSLQRKPRPWKCLDSDKEITELLIINTRPLFEVEVKTCFPKIKDPEKLWIRDANGVRDGYIELIPYRVKYNNVMKRRVDCDIQVSPLMIEKEAQTVLRYPQNKWTMSLSDNTQIQDAGAGTGSQTAIGGGDETGAENEDDENSDDESDEDEDDNIGVEGEKNDVFAMAAKRMRRLSYVKTLNEFLNGQEDDVSEMLVMNSLIDIYCDDYPNLVKNHIDDSYDSMTFDEYMCFTDVRAKNKYVGCAEFHPMWTGIVAIAYSDGCSGILSSKPSLEDPIKRAVYGLNPVMIWSHTDTLRPKLWLKSYREVKTLSFCPFDENILVGGCLNGQVVLWDLRGKLEKVETVEVLSETREKYRIAMNSHMDWMKQIHDAAVIAPTVVSNLLFSHQFPITSIQWISPNFYVGETGMPILLEDNEPRSKYFMTGSEDGTILIWNLSTDNVVTAGGKKSKKSKRISKKPSALSLEESPWKVLDRIFQPCHRLLLAKPNSKLVLHIQNLAVENQPVEYYHIPNESGFGRKYFGCRILDQKDSEIEQKIYCGTMNGEVLKIMWEGLSAGTGEAINTENALLPVQLSFHDGTISSVAVNPFLNDLVLTVGGKVIAFWSDELEKGPLMWKQRKVRLTSGVWSQYKPSLFFVTTADGNVECWDLLVRSDKPIYQQTLSGTLLTSMCLHTLPLKQNLLGFSDSNGSFRIFLKPPIFMLENHTYIKKFKKLISSEFEVKQSFNEWQDEWARKNASILREKKRKEDETLRQQEEEKIRLKEERDAELEREEEELRALKARVITPEERWKRIINKLIDRTIAVKKRINKAELLEQERPLRELEAQRLEKERRVLEIMKNQKTIFNETVAILFPEAIQKAVETEALIPEEERKKQKEEFLEAYESSIHKNKELIYRQPYKSEFQWNHTLNEGKERRQALSKYCDYILLHKNRLKEECSYKKLRGRTVRLEEDLVQEI